MKYCILCRNGNDSDESSDEKDPDKKKFEGALSGKCFTLWRHKKFEFSDKLGNQHEHMLGLEKFHWPLFRMSGYSDRTSNKIKIY